MKTTNLLTALISILLAVAFYTLLERKILSYMQLRKGPNIVGPQGILQPIMDGLKLLIKEPIRPKQSSPIMFTAAPTLALTLSLFMWTPLPMPHPLLTLNLGLMLLMAISSMMVYSTLWSGWASNSKYALVGALRAVAQMISYEVTLGLILMCLTIQTGGYNLELFSTTQEQSWLVTTTWPMMMMWYISTLAETNRTPFDLAEGESELVSGFNTEYAGGMFALLFLAEYTSIILMNTLTCTLFFNPGYAQSNLFTPLLMTKTMLLTTSFLWTRATYPRFRYDQLMQLLWKQFLPLTLAMCLLYTTTPLALLALS
uniref:NADH-ubiquinone oxidoreductase chain 1 n=1 Tax=Rhampholeon uluguruensis TaxID=256675 RepID=A0A023HHF5_9SAUR|nr:NADH dehydrogenase subunit 1 [Rhampholeon uluguruensis]AGK36623.1 NADH dehydrogenase subunit 1 [Rhampholeon uluguruensis]AGK36626.1 NADH dehydrogenase subunit 1 [Rhampholeon uluguruensis]AGK36629.1 NADH dehydrogenase subunit 1 [Rhampholeon uluguruensis]